MIDLSGNHAFVAGASGGIGEAITKQLHKLGAHVHISGSNVAKLEALGAELGNDHTIKQCDLSDALACDSILDDVEKLDILVCNAEITRDNLAIKTSNDDFADVINLNSKANFALNRAAIKKMMSARDGRIINISLIVGVSGNAGQANHCAPKAGLIGMTKSFAIEVATRGITINAVAPGFIKSNMTDVLTDAQKDAITQKIPTKTLVQQGALRLFLQHLQSAIKSLLPH